MSIMGLIKQSVTPNPPASGEVDYFMNAQGRLCTIDEYGVVTVLAANGDNLLINGGFNIQQRQVPASTAIAGISTTTRAGQVADRWAVTTSVASNLNWQQVDSGSAPETGLVSRYYGSIIKASAVKKVLLSQFILSSDMIHARGQKVRLSVKTNIKIGNAQTLRLGLLQLTAAGTIDVCPAFLASAFSAVSGTDPVFGTNLAAIAPDSSIVPENGTINGNWLDISALQTTWQRSSVVFTVPSNAKNLVPVLFSYDSGGTTDNISVAEFQLTIGPAIVDYVEPPRVETLMRCQRFYSKSFPIAIAPAASTTVANAGYGATGLLAKAGSAVANAAIIEIKFPMRMWKVPTVTYFTPITTGALIYRHTGATPAVQGATATLTSSLTDIGVIVTATSEATANGVAGDLCSIHWTADAEFLT